MRAGRLRHSIVIERLVPDSPDQDAGGTPSAAWATFANARAFLNPLKGRQLLAAQALYPEVTGEIRLRYVSGVTAEMRVRFGSRLYDILAAINVDERGREILLYVKEGPNSG